MLSPTDADLAACRALLLGGSKSFAMAARLLPRAVRDPAVALYAFCREADDVIDQGLGGLDWLRQRLAQAYQGRPLDVPTDRAFAEVVGRLAIPQALPEALLEGFAWDRAGRRYQNVSELRAYAVRVAGSVGAMMALVMGVRDPQLLSAAIELGVAMQLSNIARDVGEDARNGRVYLPLDWLTQAEIDPDRFLARPEHSHELGRVVSCLLDAAEEHYRQARHGIARLPASCRFGIGVAALVYREIGRQVGRNGMNSVSARAVVSPRRKIAVIASGLAGMTIPLRPLHGLGVPEGAFLVEIVASHSVQPVAANDPSSWNDRSGDSPDETACFGGARKPMLTEAGSAGPRIPWWDAAERLQRTIELFARLESQEHVGT